VSGKGRTAGLIEDGHFTAGPNDPAEFARHTDASLAFETPFNATGIGPLKREMIRRQESTNSRDRMPKPGTTIPHTEGIALLKQYLNSF
jgi:hypothetical protein